MLSNGHQVAQQPMQRVPNAEGGHPDARHHGAHLEAELVEATKRGEEVK